MSGLIAAVAWNGAPMLDHARRMAAALRHRGEPDMRQALGESVALATLGESSTRGADGLKPPIQDFPIAAHARLDDRANLIARLCDDAAGPDAAAGDVELLARAYRKWGADLGAHVLGDYAVAIWDAGQRRLLALRDPMGMKPLYCRHTALGTYLASEIKALLAVPDARGEVDEGTLGRYMAEIHLPAEATFFKGIIELAPGFVYCVERGELTRHRYWDIDPRARARISSVEDAIEQFRELLLTAVSDRLASRQPCGIFLSGGMDSGSVAGAAGWLAREGRVPAPGVHTYSWGFERFPECDERHISDRIVERYGLPARVMPIDEMWPFRPLPESRIDTDSPISGAYQLQICRTLQAAREAGMRGMMMGHRGDLIAGCEIVDLPGLLLDGRWGDFHAEFGEFFKRYRKAPRAHLIHKFLLQPLKLTLWPRYRLAGAREALGRLGRGGRPAKRLSTWIRPDFAARHGLAEPDENLPWPRGLSPYARVRRYQSIMLPIHVRVAVWLERLFTRHGMEYMDVWSDRRLIEMAVALPQYLFFREHRDKWLVREAMREILPAEVTEQRIKILPRAFYQAAVGEYERDRILGLFRESRLAEMGLVDAEALIRDYEGFARGEHDDERFYYALTAELWLREVDPR